MGGDTLPSEVEGHPQKPDVQGTHEHENVGQGDVGVLGQYLNIAQG